MKRTAAFLLFALALGGCATAVGTIPAEHNLQSSDESVVVGRVEMVTPDGQPWAPGPAFIVGRMSLTAEHESSQKTYAIGCDSRGFLSDFYVSLPAGRYRITKWESRVLGLYAQVQAWFDVVPRQVVYIGTLRFTGGEGVFSRHLGGWTLIDGSESTLRSFRERFPQLQQTVVKSLVRFGGDSDATR